MSCIFQYVKVVGTSAESFLVK